jgi:hypothetical protein
MAKTCSFLQETERANTMVGVDIVDSFIDASSGATRITTDFYNLLTDDPTALSGKQNCGLSTLLLTDDPTALSDNQNCGSTTLSLSVTVVGTGNASIHVPLIEASHCYCCERYNTHEREVLKR